MDRYTEMTVSELRSLAKERGIKLPVGSVKQTIIDLLNEDDKASAPPPEKPRVYKVASIISDDEEEEESTSYYAPRPAVTPPPAPKPKEPGASTLSTISSKAPAFTLEGSRTWHNPRAYQAQSSYPGKSGWASSQKSGYIAQEKAALEASRQGQAPLEGGYVSGRNVPVSRYERPAPEEDRPVREAPEPMSANEYSGATVAELLAAGDCGDGSGVLEIHPDGFGFLRSGSGKNNRGDVYVSNAQIRRFSLRTGDFIEGKTRPGKEGERYSALLYITKINGMAPEEMTQRLSFDDLTPEYPAERITLSEPDQYDPLNTAIDLVCPIGFGQRALLVLPEGEPGDAFVSGIIKAVRAAKPKAVVTTIYVGGRPEDLAAVKASASGENLYLPCDMLPDQVIRSADIALERARREAEKQGDAVLIVDSLDQLAENCVLQDRVSFNGDSVGAPALGRLRRLFGSARKLREGGSLTVIGILRRPLLPEATALGLERSANAVLRLTAQGSAAMPLGLDVKASRNDRREQLLTAEDRLLADKIMLRLKGAKDPSRELTGLMTASKDFNKVLMNIMGL